jgi:DnaJ-class molecular chaperone
LRKGYVRKSKVERLHVEVPRGSKNGDKIVVREKGDMLPGAMPGDVVFVVKRPKDEGRAGDAGFTRKGNDLLVEKTIGLVEALCGFSWTLEHLDGKDVTIDTKSGDVVGSQAIRCIPDLGMPVKDTLDRGRLFIRFKVEFPAQGSVTSAHAALLEKALGPRRLPQRGAAALITPASNAVATCAVCKKISQRMLRCGRCKVAQYCSQTCQKRHWSSHKKVCKKGSKAKSNHSTNEKLKADDTFTLEEVDPVTFGRTESGARGAMDESDDESGPAGPQCRQM